MGPFELGDAIHQLTKKAQQRLDQRRPLVGSNLGKLYLHACQCKNRKANQLREFSEKMRSYIRSMKTSQGDHPGATYRDAHRLSQGADRPAPRDRRHDRQVSRRAGLGPAPFHPDRGGRRRIVAGLRPGLPGTGLSAVPPLRRCRHAGPYHPLCRRRRPAPPHRLAALCRRRVCAAAAGHGPRALRCRAREIGALAEGKRACSTSRTSGRATATSTATRPSARTV